MRVARQFWVQDHYSEEGLMLCERQVDGEMFAHPIVGRIYRTKHQWAVELAVGQLKDMNGLEPGKVAGFLRSPGLLKRRSEAKRRLLAELMSRRGA